MTTLLAVLTVWTLLATLTAAGFCLVFAGARRGEEQALRTRGPRATGPVAVPRPRTEHAVRLPA